MIYYLLYLSIDYIAYIHLFSYIFFSLKEKITILFILSG